MNNFILPSSWHIDNKQTEDIVLTKKNIGKNYLWLTNGSLRRQNTKILLTNLGKNNKFVLRGVRKTLLDKLLSKQGGEFIISGTEAIIYLQNYSATKTVKELSRRGKRNSDIKEISRNISAYQNKIYQLLELKRQEWQVELTHLFLTHFNSPLRTFILEKNDKILGLITISPFCKNCWQIEQMMRSPNANVGVMEALISFIINKLQTEGNTILSLGEVPFHFSGNKISLKNRLYSLTGRYIRFAYDSVGLYNFKNKFRPEWYPLFLYGYPRLSYGTMYKMMKASGIEKLIIKRAVSFI